MKAIRPKPLLISNTLRRTCAGNRDNAKHHCPHPATVQSKPQTCQHPARASHHTHAACHNPLNANNPLQSWPYCIQPSGRRCLDCPNKLRGKRSLQAMQPSCSKIARSAATKILVLKFGFKTCKGNNPNSASNIFRGVACNRLMRPNRSEVVII